MSLEVRNPLTIPIANKRSTFLFFVKQEKGVSLSKLHATIRNACRFSTASARDSVPLEAIELAELLPSDRNISLPLYTNYGDSPSTYSNEHKVQS